MNDATIDMKAGSFQEQDLIGSNIFQVSTWSFVHFWTKLKTSSLRKHYKWWKSARSHLHGTKTSLPSLMMSWDQ